VADRTSHESETVKPESVLVPVAALPKVLCMTATELRTFLVLAALSPTGGGRFNTQIDALRAEYKSAVGTGISARKLDAALGVLAYAGAVESERGTGGVLSIRVRAAFRVSLSDSALTEISKSGESESGEGGNGGKGRKQGGLFTELRDVPESERKLTREVTEKCLRAWANRTGRNPNRARVTPKRLRMVGARLREGYTPDDLYRAVAGLCYSEWHRENGHDRFELAVRNGERVEACHDMWLRHAPPDKVAAFEAATGEVVAHRQDEIAEQEREERERAEYAAQLEEVERKRAEQEAAALAKQAEDQSWDELLEQGTEGE
jgi:hypothetical protein